ncbi:hypothetical protein [Rhizohabitans arisaemae]|uniref:hypothetical protein n=1 Tax=Rhizohabitans arisaemae TaxID=2720610 RepID=UPI0024B1C2BF|nr:hypothetical protein [Rhizohabitans arisaemae]
MLGSLLAVLTAAVVLVGLALNRAKATETERALVVQAAGRHAVDLLSIDYRTVDRDIERILRSSTGGARQEYGDKAFKETILKNKAIETGLLRASGLVSFDGDAAEVLVVADATIRWQGQKVKSEDRLYRWRMQVVKVGDRWLVAKSVDVGW